jgi:hypothetical protein
MPSSLEYTNIDSLLNCLTKNLGHVAHNKFTYGEREFFFLNNKIQLFSIDIISKKLSAIYNVLYY